MRMCFNVISDMCFQLQTKLNPDELRQFAKLLKAWHTKLPFPEFCDKVLELYGPNRKHMLSGRSLKLCANAASIS